MDSYRIGFFGGTAFGVLPNLPVEDIVVTLIMAALGAIASFFVSVVLRCIGKRFRCF